MTALENIQNVIVKKDQGMFKLEKEKPMEYILGIQKHLKDFQMEKSHFVYGIDRNN